jgi:hypothetical protein
VELVGVAKLDIPDGQAIGSSPFSNPSIGQDWATCCYAHPAPAAQPGLPATAAKTGRRGWAALLVLLSATLLIGESRWRPVTRPTRR